MPEGQGGSETTSQHCPPSITGWNTARWRQRPSDGQGVSDENCASRSAETGKAVKPRRSANPGPGQGPGQDPGQGQGPGPGPGAGSGPGPGSGGARARGRVRSGAGSGPGPVRGQCACSGGNWTGHSADSSRRNGQARRHRPLPQTPNARDFTTPGQPRSRRMPPQALPKQAWRSSAGKGSGPGATNIGDREQTPPDDAVSKHLAPDTTHPRTNSPRKREGEGEREGTPGQPRRPRRPSSPQPETAPAKPTAHRIQTHHREQESMRADRRPPHARTPLVQASGAAERGGRGHAGTDRATGMRPWDMETAAATGDPRVRERTQTENNAHTHNHHAQPTRTNTHPTRNTDPKPWQPPAQPIRDTAGPAGRVL